jgi:signal transduction histidine kinase
MAFILLATLICYFTLEYQMEKILFHEVDEEMMTLLEKINNYTREHHELPPLSIVSTHAVQVSAVTYSAAFVPYFKSSLQYLEHKKGERPFRELNLQIVNNHQAYLYKIEKQVEGTRLLKKNITLICLSIFFALILGLLSVNRVVLKNSWRPFYEALALVKDFKLNKEASELSLPQTQIVEFEDMNAVITEAMNKARKDYQTLKEFTQSASHELQTPLAITRSKLDLLLQQNDLSIENQKLLASIYVSIQRLADLNRSLLLLARMDNDQFEKVEVIDLKEKLTEKLEQFQEWINDSGISLTTNLQESKLSIHPMLCDILLNNLLSNAIRHNIPNGAMTISTTVNSVAISNSGIAEALPTDKIFLLFYKNGKDSEGAGVGLSLVQKIATITQIEIKYIFSSPHHHTFQLLWSSF